MRAQAWAVLNSAVVKAGQDAELAFSNPLFILSFPFLYFCIFGCFLLIFISLSFLLFSPFHTSIYRILILSLSPTRTRTVVYLCILISLIKTFRTFEHTDTVRYSTKYYKITGLACSRDRGYYGSAITVYYVRTL